MLIEKQKLRGNHRRHQKRKCLPLATGQKSNRLLHAIFKSHIKESKLFTEIVLILFRNMTEQIMRTAGGPEKGNRQILFDRHMRRRTHQRILEQPTDHLTPDMLRHKRDILIIQLDEARICKKRARDRIK